MDHAAALTRWIAALNELGEGVEEAVEADVRVRRHGWAEGQEVEEILGVEGVRAWMERCKVRDLFSLDGPPGPTCRYRVRWGDYVNGGTWTFTFSPRGRVQTLEHLPDELPAQWREGPPEGAVLPETPEVASHDHSDDV